MLIGITGKKGAGKDTLASVLTERNFYNAKMAEPLKNMLRSLYQDAGFDWVEVERRIEGDLKETPCEILCGQTPRYAMQTLGDEWRRLIGNDLWTKMWANRVANLLRQGSPIVCTDIRYLAEAQLVKDMGGYLVRVSRPGTEGTDTHVSETEMDQIQADYSIHNLGSIYDLQQTMKTLLGELSNG